MQIISTVDELRQRLAAESAIAFVPTLGNLHMGHINLVNVAKQQTIGTKKPYVVVSIFVNPLQFGANEDLANYPRTLHADLEKLKSAGADIVFTPEVSELYPDYAAKTSNLGQTMMVTPPPIAHELCGAARPGHFSGVATVVLKLFNLVKPTIAVFGKKDFQQLFIIRELVRQFNLPISIIGVDTTREADGLAMSSRNGYLTQAERTKAAELHNALSQVISNVQNHHMQHIDAELKAIKHLTAEGWGVDYISIRASSTLLPAKSGDNALVVLGAARLGKTRLIDNIEFNLV